ncbi:MAG: glycosyltransferase family 2 protein [Candidatus Omnitrophica bacterium]|nr:glycosyltransferase family 2 protein [Candidatus Omnitrophota bacterium]
MKLSVLIPVYNEEESITEIIDIVKRIQIDKEIIIVDDGSNIDTKMILHRLEKQFDENVIIIYRDKNAGKGAAIKTGLAYIGGDVVIIQDADLEYDPADYLKLISPISKGYAEVVYGSRFLMKRRLFRSLHYFVNYFLTSLTNILYNSKLTDMETCYKVLKTDIIKQLNLESSGFEIEAEITSKLLKKGYKIFDVPINYRGRRYFQGKKITWRDGIKAIITLLKYRFN